MENRVARFEKVSLAQFTEDWRKTISFGDKYTDIEILNIYNNIKKPYRGTSGSAGYDIFSPLSITLKPGETFNIPTGIRCKIAPDWFMGVYPRSGLGFKYAIRLNNTVGIVDSDYFFSDNEGHIFVKLINDSSILTTVNIKQGDGIAQAIFMPYGITVDDNCTEVRNGGFGSTDRK